MKKENAFDWDIKKQPIFDIHGNVISGYNEIKRDDNDKHIVIRPDTFHPMTTQEFSDISYEVADKFGAKDIRFVDWDTTNKKKNIGQAKPVITCQMEISEPLEIAGSKIEGKLTLGVGFAGNRSFFIGHTNNYLRCSNQFASIIKDFTSRLTKNNMVRVKDIIENIEVYREYERKLYLDFKNFKKSKVDENMIQECVARIVNLTEEEKMIPLEYRKDEIKAHKLNKMDDILASIRSEIGDLGYNAWGLFNGVTHYSTHVMSSRGSNENSVMFGAKNDINQKAYNFCREVMFEPAK
jgi:hypothetical protein